MASKQRNYFFLMTEEGEIVSERLYETYGKVVEYSKYMVRKHNTTVHVMGVSRVATTVIPQAETNNRSA